jgi:hypothetical protein
MYYNFTFLIVILLLISLQPVLGQTNESEPDGSISIANFSSDVEEKIYFSSVSRDDVRNTPSWDSLSEKNPPVSIKDALTKAQDSLKQFVKDIKDWEVSDIRLIPLVVNQRWIYIIEFRNKTQKEGSPKGQFFRIVVKMDGLVVEPELLDPNTGNLGIPK